MKFLKLAALAGALAFCATPAAAQKLTFTLNWVAGGDHAPYFYAQKMGWYKQAGLDIDFETGRGSAASAQKVGAGASQAVGRNPGADIIFDVKCSRHLNSLISEYGGRPIMWKTGHSHMKAKLKETGALLAGEFMVVAQAIATGVFAELQYAGLRRSGGAVAA